MDSQYQGAMFINGVYIFDRSGNIYVNKSYVSRTDSVEYAISLKETAKKELNSIFFHRKEIVLKKVLNGIIICMVCDSDQNELMVQQILDSLVDGISSATKDILLKKSAVEKYYDVFLYAVDRVIDNGIPLEIDPVELSNSLSKASRQIEFNFKEQAIGTAIKTARSWHEQFFSSRS